MRQSPHTIVATAVATAGGDAARQQCTASPGVVAARTNKRGGGRRRRRPTHLLPRLNVCDFPHQAEHFIEIIGQKNGKWTSGLHSSFYFVHKYRNLARCTHTIHTAERGV